MILTMYQSFRRRIGKIKRTFQRGRFIRSWNWL